MRKINKITNIALIFMLIWVVACQDLCALRVPINGYKEVERALGQEIAVEKAAEREIAEDKEIGTIEEIETQFRNSVYILKTEFSHRPRTSSGKIHLDIIDLGTNSGRVPYMLKKLLEENGFEIDITGIDETLSRLDSRWTEDLSVKFIQCQTEDTLAKFGENSFDVVVWSGLTGDVTGTDALLFNNGLKKLLREDGLFIFRGWRGEGKVWFMPTIFRIEQIFEWKLQTIPRDLCQLPRDQAANRLRNYEAIMIASPSFVEDHAELFAGLASGQEMKWDPAWGEPTEEGLRIAQQFMQYWDEIKAMAPCLSKMFEQSAAPTAPILTEEGRDTAKFPIESQTTSDVFKAMLKINFDWAAAMLVSGMPDFHHVADRILMKDYDKPYAAKAVDRAIELLESKSPVRCLTKTFNIRYNTAMFINSYLQPSNVGNLEGEFILLNNLKDKSIAFFINYYYSYFRKRVDFPAEYDYRKKAYKDLIDKREKVIPFLTPEARNWLGLSEKKFPERKPSAIDL